MPTTTTPINPIKAAPIINIKRYNLIALVNSNSEKGKLDMAVIAIIIIIIGDTIPAATAASPNIKAPTIDRALPAGFGTLISLSLNISKAIIIIIASKKAGKGTPSLWVAKLTSKSVGIISWLYVVIAMYKAGVKIDIINAIYLIILVKETFKLFP